VLEVAGGAFCTKDDDCTILPEGDFQFIKMVTGKCERKRCACLNGDAWGGPRCTVVMDASKALSGGTTKKLGGFGPPFELAAGVAVVVIFVTTLSVWWAVKKAHTEAQAALRQVTADKSAAARESSDLARSWGSGPSRVDYNPNNFV
jgi:hypothetical protein